MDVNTNSKRHIHSRTFLEEMMMPDHTPYDVDPVMCCAARVCCNRAAARQATAKMLTEMGVEDSSLADEVAMAMESRGVIFMPAAMGDFIKAFRDVKHTA